MSVATVVYNPDELKIKLKDKGDIVIIKEPEKKDKKQETDKPKATEAK